MRKWAPLVAVCLGTFMLLVDVTIVNVALPDMAADLSTSFGSLQWVVDAYALTLAALLLGIGSIADLVGHRRAYIAGLALFAAASFVCGIAPNSGALIAARFVQGIGGAAMLATTFALLNSSYTGRDRGTAYGMWGAVAGASAAVGPIVGGILTQAISWRWIFFVNLPVSLLAIAMSVLVLNDVKAPSHARVDIAGTITFTASSAAITYALIRANEHGWASLGTWGTLTVGAILLALFVAIEQRVEYPMLDLELLRNRSFVGVLIAGLLLSFAAFGYLTYTSIWLQSVLHLTPIQAGLTGLPMSVAAFAVSAAIGRFLHGARPDLIIGGGMALIGLGSLVSAVLVRGSAGWPQLVPGFLVAGLGVGLAIPTLSSSAMAAVPPQRGGMASGAVNTVRQLGFAFGIALLGSAFEAKAQDSLAAHHVAHATAAAHGLAGGQAPFLLTHAPAASRAALDHALHVASISGLQSAFVVAGIAGLLAGGLAYVLIRPGAPVSHNAPKPAPAQTPA
jgi:EmrB/QacA subfamily drug resistance transporter